MNYIISEILKTRKITDYLSSKGIYPTGNTTGGKSKYCCPLHKGDNTPSFIVYLNSEFENYFCYGCKSHYNIIHLYKELEKVSIKKAIEDLSNGLKLDVNTEIDHIIREIENDTSISSEFSPVDLSLIISRTLYDFKKLVKKDALESEKVDKLLQIVDNCVDECNLTGLKTIYDSLGDVLKIRVKEFEDKLI